MRIRVLFVAAALTCTIALPKQGTALPVQEAEDDPIRVLVSRLTLDNYKTTLKGLTQFGDRRQGTQRNRDAVDWIEEQLKAVGCTNTERITYDFDPAPPTARTGRGGRGGPPVEPDLTTATGGLVGRNGDGPGGSSIYGYRARTGVNRDLDAQPDERIRELNREEPVNGERTDVYCT